MERDTRNDRTNAVRDISIDISTGKAVANVAFHDTSCTPSSVTSAQENR